MAETRQAGLNGIIEPISEHREQVRPGMYKITALPFDTPQGGLQSGMHVLTDTVNPYIIIKTTEGQ